MTFPPPAERRDQSCAALFSQSLFASLQRRCHRPRKLMCEHRQVWTIHCNVVCCSHEKNLSKSSHNCHGIASWTSSQGFSEVYVSNCEVMPVAWCGAYHMRYLENEDRQGILSLFHVCCLIASSVLLTFRLCFSLCLDPLSFYGECFVLHIWESQSFDPQTHTV